MKKNIKIYVIIVLFGFYNNLSFAGVSIGDLKCDFNISNKALCLVLQDKVNYDAEQRGFILSNGITIKNIQNDFVFRKDPLTPKKSIPTGHSCTRRIDAGGGYLESRFSAYSEFDISGDFITSPLLLSFSIPTKLYARIDVKDRIGTRNIFGNCNTIATDHYYVDSRVDANIGADVLVTSGIEVMNNGSRYQVKIRPKVYVNPAVASTVEFVDIGIHNENAIHQFFGGIISILSTSASLVFNILSFDNISADIDQLKTDFVLTFSLPLLSIADHRIIDSVVTINARNKADDIYMNIENNMNSKLTDVFGLDANGMRVINIDVADVSAREYSFVMPAINSLLLN